ncbi:MAG: excinuclease ABC subunit UvrC, partial [candidate division Zixibacteria bacterium]|nr:excinuclease ABC subunit UvrC [candidate division Zixibacteria bacterium]
MAPHIAELDLKLRNLPSSPGVYLFRDRRGRILYIGKAKILRNRVRSYFQRGNGHEERIARMVAQVADLEVIVTDSEVEALIFEANLVREHKPHYNVNLKDDKHFPYIKITTNEPFPRVLIVRRIEKDGATYFGPYTSAKGMRRTVAFLTQLFKIRSCSYVIPPPEGKTLRVCLDYHIKRCGGPCEGLVDQANYRRGVEAVIMVLRGKSRSLTEQLTARMHEASAAERFEEAAEARDQIEAIESVMIKQKVDVGEPVDRDIVAVAREGGDAVGVVMQIREGVLIGRQDFQLTAGADRDDQAVLATFLMHYYNHQPNLPDEVHLPFAMEDLDLFAEWLRRQKGAKVKVQAPQIGEKSKLVELTATNARLLLDELLIQKRQVADRTSRMVTGLKDALKLAVSPREIVCFDISNTGETDAVGSAVYFSNGKPYKSEYRHFRIKGVKGQDDFKMMREVVGRYFHRRTEEQKRMPDLVVVDGGKGQLSAARKELQRAGLAAQPVIGLAKRLEEIYVPGAADPIVIPRSSPALLLLKHVRDEAHRFAVEYNRNVRTKRTIKSVLGEIRGIGPARQQALLREFGSVEQIRQQTAERLAEVKGITRALAERVL